MAVKQTIAIIGAAGKMGSALAKSLARGNYRLLLFARDRQQADRLALHIRQETPYAEVDCVGCPFHASWEADIIIPAVPYRAEAEVARSVKEVATQKIVVSISNPLTENGVQTGTRETSTAEELQTLLPASKVVKAFNTVLADHFTAEPDKDPVDSFVAGDDQEAVDATVELVRAAGLNPVVAGKLAVSRTLENMSALLAELNQRYHSGRFAGWKLVHQ